MIVNGERRNRFIGGAIDYIWRQSGGLVFYIQYICIASVNFMNERHINVVNDIYVKQAIRNALEKENGEDNSATNLLGHPLFQASEGNGGISDEQNKIILDAITKTTTLSSGSDEESISAYLNDTYGQSALPQELIKQIINSLLSRRVIFRDEKGNYNIIAKFYSDYLNDYIMRSILPV